MSYIHYGSHTVYDIQYHIVWTTKYRYKILQGKIAVRLKDLIRQGMRSTKYSNYQRKYRERTCASASVLSTEYSSE